MILHELKVIMVEDNTTDAVLIERQICKVLAYPNILLVSTIEALKSAIVEFDPDVILCDYQLNGFTGFDVLSYINKLDRYIPLIFITGTINDEELAASSILSGATGYILKKNINSLHEKLLPHFNKIVDNSKIEVITPEHVLVLQEMQNYLKGVKVENKMIKASYIEMKKSLEILKALNK